MKRILAVILSLLLFGSVALADVDLSGMTFDELVALRDKINLAIWESQEWQEVTVPIGVWRVGEDIPAGHRTIKAAPGGNMSWGVVTYGTKLDELGKVLEYDSEGFYYSEQVKAEGSNASVTLSEIDIDMQDGAYVVIGECDMIFTPYSGKPSLGFK